MRFREKQTGQTLIETLVGVSVLTLGIIAGLSLAIYSFSGINNAATSDVASGLAREGVEIARRLRDSNWMAGTVVDCGGYFCITTWLSNPYNITGSAGGTNYRAIFNPAASGNKWTMAAAAPGTDYRLYIQSSGEYTHTVTASPSRFFRRVSIIYSNTTSPYDATSPLVLVRSTVWWTDRRCPLVTDPDLTACKVNSEIFLANWRF